MSWRSGSTIIIAFLVATSVASRAAEPADAEPVAAQPPAAKAEPFKPETRQLVEMPEEAQRLLRSDMFDHLVAITLLMGHLAASEFEQASELAEARLGNSSRGRHRGTGFGPGRFMPPGMHQIGFGMHQSATDFAKIAKNEDLPSALSALRRVTNSCVACHAGFRIR
ncbi:MAG: cytochrome C [bacterium]|nr:cytochrome C [bacterium]